MTEQLKTLMDRAADRDFGAVDLDAITSAGDRTVRRRRVATGVAAVAAVAVVGAAAVLVGGDGDGKADFTDVPFRTDVPMWTEGSTLHTPDRTYDLGGQVVGLAKTTAGIAFVTADRSVYAFTGDERRRIGMMTGDQDALVGDADGTRVGWIDRTRERPTFVVYDLDSGTEQTYDEGTHAGMAGFEPPDLALFFAIDGETAYWIDSRGTVATDLESGDSEVIGDPARPSFVIDAEGGTIVNFLESEAGEDLGTQVLAPDGTELLGPSDTDTLGKLSPDARWAVSYDSASVWEVGTGQQTLIEVPGVDGDVIGFEWIDESRFVAFAESEDEDTLRLLQCRVPEVTCTDVATLDLTSGAALPGTGLLFGVTAEQYEMEASESSSTERPD